MTTVMLNWMKNGRERTDGDVSMQRGHNELHFTMEQQAMETTGHPFLAITLLICFILGMCSTGTIYFTLLLLCLVMRCLCLCQRCQVVSLIVVRKGKGRTILSRRRRKEVDHKFLLKSIHGLHSGLNQNVLQSLKDKRYEIMLFRHQQTDAKMRKIVEVCLTDTNQDITKLESY